MVRSLSCFFLWLSLATPLHGAELPIVVPVDAEPFPAMLAAADAEGRLAFQTPNQRRALDRQDLVRWGRYPEPHTAPILLLREGSLLVARIVQADQEHVTADSELLGLLRLPLLRVAAAIFELPASPLQRDRLFDDALRADEGTTRVVLLNGDVVHGRFVAVASGELQLHTEAGPLNLPLGRISTVTLPRDGGGETAQLPNPMIVGLDDGTRIVAEDFTVEGQEVKIGGAGSEAWHVDRDSLVHFESGSPRIVYLSDLEPAGYRHVPFLDLPWDYRLDRNVLGGLLRSDGQIYRKGIGMHTASRLTFAAPADARAFQAWLAIDDAAGLLGSVRYRVFVDGSQKYVSPTIRGGDPPEPIEIDVQGAARLDLVVDYADRADVRDYANWLEARFIR